MKPALSLMHQPGSSRPAATGGSSTPSSQRKPEYFTPPPRHSILVTPALPRHPGAPSSPRRSLVTPAQAGAQCLSWTRLRGAFGPAVWASSRPASEISYPEHAVNSSMRARLRPSGPQTVPDSLSPPRAMSSGVGGCPARCLSPPRAANSEVRRLFSSMRTEAVGRHPALNARYPRRSILVTPAQAGAQCLSWTRLRGASRPAAWASSWPASEISYPGHAVNSSLVSSK